MLWICILLLSLGALTIVFYVIEKLKAYSLKAVAIKAVASLLFVALAAYSSFVKHGHIINPFIILGLILGLTGDIWLDLKYVYPKDDKIYTYCGFIVFGLGHILFISGMHLEYLGDNSVLYILIPIIIAVVGAIANYFLAIPLKLKFGDYKLIVFLYSVMLFSFPLSSLSLLILNGWNNTTLVMLFVGGLLFMVSDLVLSGTYFGENHEKPIDFILNYLTYYSAQFVIAFSLFFL